MDYPLWLQIILVLALSLALSALAIWLSMNAIKAAIDAESRLQHKKRYNENKALNKWQKLYEEEHDCRLKDNEILIQNITNLQTENARLKGIMAKVKVADIEKAVRI